MKSIENIVAKVTAYFFILLFWYAAVSKVLDFENFQVQLAQSPLLSAYAGFVSYGVIVMEVVVALMLAFPERRRAGLYASFGLMVAFTVYIFLILNYSEFIPCSCGGILEKMSWQQHLVFNMGCVLLAIVAIIMDEKKRARRFRRTAAVSSLIFLISAGGMVVLFLSSEYIMKKENNFTRRFLQNPVNEKKTLLLNGDRYYFAGVFQQKIYLGNAEKPLILTSVDLNLSHLQEVKIEPEMAVNFNFKNIRVQVRGRHFYLSDGTVPVIFEGLLTDPKAKIISRNEVYFTEMQVLDSTHFVMRSQSSKSHESIITALPLTSSPQIIVNAHLLEKQVDGVFDVDGILKTDLGKAVYMYYYRNQFLVFNDQLRLLNKLHTIDPTKTAKISVLKLKNGSRRMDAPPMKVNENVTLYNNMVFNISNMRGKFETYNEWKHYSVVDIYKSNLQYYIGSFRIRKDLREEKSDLLVTDHSFYIIQGNELRQYSYNKSMRDLTAKGETENLDKE